MESFFDEIVCAGDAKEALGLYMQANDSRAFDVVISDINLPSFSGLELVKKIRQTNPKELIVIVSAYEHTDYFLKCIEYGIFAFLVKPFDSALLIKTFAKLKDEINRRAFRYKEQKEIYLTLSVKYNVEDKLLYVNDEPKVLGKKEIALLDLLVKNKGHYISTDHIKSVVYEDEDIKDSTLRALVNRLRNHLLDASLIENIKNVGYKINTSSINEE